MYFEVLADRALDIGRVNFGGVALAWASSVGEVHPAYYEAEGLGWLRSFSGGLMTTCGLDQFGSPNEDAGEVLGIHGRVGNLPSEQTAYRCYWDDDTYRMELSGTIRQTRLFGENLILHRQISTALGSNVIDVRDSVTNEGFNIQPHMILYHCNLGFPLLGPDATLNINAAETTPRDTAAATGIDDWSRFDTPMAYYAEQVFRHSVVPGDDNIAAATLRNPSVGLALTMQWRQDTMPHLFQWKQMGQGAYALGLEPANSAAIQGRAVARQQNDLPHLSPGETRHYALRFVVDVL